MGLSKSDVLLVSSCSEWINLLRSTKQMLIGGMLTIFTVDCLYFMAFYILMLKEKLNKDYFYISVRSSFVRDQL